MSMHRKLAAVLILSVLLWGCNSGSDSADGGGPGGGESALSAKLDDVEWLADAKSIEAEANDGMANSITVSGSRTIDGKALAFIMRLHNVEQAGKYTLGVDPTGFGGSVEIRDGTGTTGRSETWVTPGNGMAGEVEITSLAGGRLVGTFRFTAVPGRNNPSKSPLEVTEGKFDLALQGTLKPLAENAGSRVKAKLNGKPYHAASVTANADFTTASSIHFTSTTDSNSLSLSLVGVNDTGTYSLSATPKRLMTAGASGSPSCCHGDPSEDRGEVRITSITPKRMKGTFSAVLKARQGTPATEDLSITEGEFDVGASTASGLGATFDAGGFKDGKE